MKKLTYFVIMLGKAAVEDEIFPLASELTYPLIFAIFPFIIFMMSLIGFFNLNSNDLMLLLEDLFPEDMMEIISVFVHEVVDVKNTGILSGSLALSIFSASAGFKAIIRGINRAYDTKETRNLFHVWIIRASLVFVLAFSIIASILLLVFGDTLHSLFLKYIGFNRYAELLFGLSGGLVTLVVLLFTVVFIYKFGSCKKLSVYQVMPGSLVTLIVWIAASKIFNIYVNNFSRYSMIYGSIASIFITMLWVNIISVIILIGAEINALLNIEIET